MKRRKCINLNIKKIREKNHIKKLSIKRKRIRKGREKSKDQANPYDSFGQGPRVSGPLFFFIAIRTNDMSLVLFF
jgi:hypothetical protein